MSELNLTTVPAVLSAMRIRRPVAAVFEAFVDPAVTSRFWFTHSSGRVEPGARLLWHWEMFGVSAPVSVLAVEPNARILIEWPDENGPTRVEWRFEALEDDTTYVRITNTGFAGTGDEVVAQALGSTQGFALVLAGLKALLEHGVELNLVVDRVAEGIPLE